MNVVNGRSSPTILGVCLCLALLCGSLSRAEIWRDPEPPMSWQAMLACEPFRVMQSVNPELARDALEELGRTRDPACLDQLFGYVLSPVLQGPFNWFHAGSVLSRIGDQDGDVYDRAAKLIRDNAPGAIEYRFAMPATLMAGANQQRAATDLPKLLIDKNLLLRKAALAGLGSIPQRVAVQLALDRLRDPDLAESALSSIRSQLRWDHIPGSPRLPGIDEKDWILEQLRIASSDSGVPADTRAHIRRSFGHVLRRISDLDLDQLLTRLSDPADRSYTSCGHE